MHVVILTFGLTVLTLGISGYPVSRISKEGNTAMTSRGTSAAVPQVEAIATPNDFKEAPLVRRVNWNGDGGAGIGVSAGPGVSTLIPAQQHTGRILVPANPNPQPANSNPLPVTPQPVTPPITPPVTNDPEADSTEQTNSVPPLRVNANMSAARQIRLLSCMNWFYGDGGAAKPYHCDSSAPALGAGF